MSFTRHLVPDGEQPHAFTAIYIRSPGDAQSSEKPSHFGSASGNHRIGNAVVAASDGNSRHRPHCRTPSTRVRRATGGDVFDWILDQGYYTEKDTSNVIRQVLEAVAYLHSLHIVHRNLKLENLMYYNQNSPSKVVLRDFYLSRFESGEITEPCGTPEYLAPEVVARHRYGRPVDCWAVGVIMFILLSGNPPFYDENEEESSETHNRNIFRKILAGDYEFDSPYWDEITPSAKELVSRLMEVDQDQRITAQEALGHLWISGNAASEKNLKEGVCAQIEKNFAKAKWRKAIRVTTFMQRLRAPDQASGRLPVTPRSSMSVAHEVTIEAGPPSPQSSMSAKEAAGAENGQSHKGKKWPDGTTDEEGTH